MEKTTVNHDKLYALIADIIDTPDVRNILSGVACAWLDKWSDSGIFKKAVGKPAGWVVSKTLAAGETRDLCSVLGKPKHIETVIGELPHLVHTVTGVIHSLVCALESLPLDRKKAMFDRLFSGLPQEPDKKILPGVTRIIEGLYTSDPFFFSSRITPMLERWIANTDFGDLKIAFDAAKPDIEALLTGVITAVFDYPAKLVTVLSVVPDMANTVLKALDTVLGQVIAMPADVFTDLVISLVRQIDATQAGKLFTKINEMVRQLHTGSTLTGEMDAPRFTSELREKVGSFMDAIDPVLVIKARNAMIDGRETVLVTLIEAAEERPELLNLWLAQLTARRNSDIRLFKRKIQVMETLPEGDAVNALSAGLSTWNAYDLAETVNAISRMMNRMHTVNSGVLKSLVTEFVNTLDRYELEETLTWAVNDLGKAIRPVFRMTAPFVVRELRGFFEHGEEDDGYNDAMDQAKEDLARLFAAKGGEGHA